MKSVNEATGSFAVLENAQAVQTAAMRLKKGEKSGPLGNEHADSTQVLLVVSGAVEARIGERTFTMKAGDSAIVAKGVEHQFAGTSDEPAVTFNVYSPPAY